MIGYEVIAVQGRTGTGRIVPNGKRQVCEEHLTTLVEPEQTVAFRGLPKEQRDQGLHILYKSLGIFGILGNQRVSGGEVLQPGTRSTSNRDRVAARLLLRRL